MPAAAVIPAPIAYIKVVAVKKLVVGFLLKTAGPPSSVHLVWLWHSSGERIVHLTVCYGIQQFYFEKIRVFQAGYCLEYFSME